MYIYIITSLLYKNLLLYSVFFCDVLSLYANILFQFVFLCFYALTVWGGPSTETPGGVKNVQKWPKMAKNGQKWPKNPQKWPKNPKIQAFLTLFWGVSSQTRLWGVFLAVPRKPDFRIGVPQIPANLDSL